MKTRIQRDVAKVFEKANEAAKQRIREELETAWLRGFAAHRYRLVLDDERELMAADYAERVLGGLTRPEKP